MKTSSHRRWVALVSAFVIPLVILLIPIAVGGWVTWVIFGLIALGVCINQAIAFEHGKPQIWERLRRRPATVSVSPRGSYRQASATIPAPVRYSPVVDANEAVTPSYGISQVASQGVDPTPTLNLPNATVPYRRHPHMLKLILSLFQPVTVLLIALVATTMVYVEASRTVGVSLLALMMAAVVYLGARRYQAKRAESETSQSRARLYIASRARKHSRAVGVVAVIVVGVIGVGVANLPPLVGQIVVVLLPLLCLGVTGYWVAWTVAQWRCQWYEFFYRKEGGAFRIEFKPPSWCFQGTIYQFVQISDVDAPSIEPTWFSRLFRLSYGTASLDTPSDNDNLFQKIKWLPNIRLLDELVEAG